MILPLVILVVSIALLFFYFQVVCQRILRRKFGEDYFRSIVEANRLEFPAVRKMLEELDTPVDYAQVRMTLLCDFLALTYLAKNAANVKQRYTREELLLIAYFRVVYASLVIRHLLKVGEKSAILRLTAILEWFGNTVGQRVAHLRFSNLSASDYLRNL
jgi:hypothetical protein